MRDYLSRVEGYLGFITCLTLQLGINLTVSSIGFTYFTQELDLHKTVLDKQRALHNDKDKVLLPAPCLVTPIINNPS